MNIQDCYIALVIAAFSYTYSSDKKYRKCKISVVVSMLSILVNSHLTIY